MSDYDERPRRRESMMEQRLRKARGEEIEDNLDAVGGYDDDYDAPRSFGGGYSSGGYGPAGGGCARAALYLILGALASLLVGAFLLNQVAGGLGRIFQPPSINQLIATPTPQIISGAAVVQRIQQLSRLETSAYTVQTVIEVTQSQGNPIFDFFAGDALLLIAHGTVTAGVDLGTLQPEDVTVAADGSQITLRLPPAQIFDTTLDNSRTRVYSRDRGWFAPENANLESLARQEAEAQILRAACDDGILTKATDEAETSLRQFLGLVDDTQVVVIAAPPAACAAPETTP